MEKFELSNDVCFDDLLKLAGTHGKWQWSIFFLASMSGFFLASHNVGAVFLAAVPDHWCSVDHYERTLANRNVSWTLEQIKDTFIPRDSEGKLEECYLYHVDIDSLDKDLLANAEQLKFEIQRQHAPKNECSLWTYSKEQYISTVVTEWDLICSKRALVSTVQSSFMAGVLIGCIIFGWISDRFGRRRAIIIALVQFVGAAIVASFSTHYVMFLVFRFICAVGEAGIFSASYVITMEISGQKNRAFLGLQFMAPFSFGFMLLPLVAYFVRDWFQLQLAISVPCLLLLSYFWLLPESPRWLLAQGRLQDALSVLQSGAKMNRRKLPCDDEMFAMLKSAQLKDKKQTSGEQKSGNFFDLVRTPVIRRRFLINGLVWFVCGMVYYGIAFSGSSLGVSVYIYLALAAAVEFPANFLVYFLIEKLGRKSVYSGTMIVSGVCCLLLLIIPSDVLWAISAVALLGKFFCTSTLGLCYLYTVELFPTPVRNIAVGSGTMISRIGAVISPFIVDILGQFNAMIPMIIFGSLALLSGLLSLLLPETMGCKLPETVEEVEHNFRNVDQQEEISRLESELDEPTSETV